MKLEQRVRHHTHAVRINNMSKIIESIIFVFSALTLLPVFVFALDFTPVFSFNRSFNTNIDLYRVTTFSLPFREDYYSEGLLGFKSSHVFSKMFNIVTSGNITLNEYVKYKERKSTKYDFNTAILISLNQLLLKPWVRFENNNEVNTTWNYSFINPGLEINWVLAAGPIVKLKYENKQKVYYNNPITEFTDTSLTNLNSTQQKLDLSMVFWHNQHLRSKIEYTKQLGTYKNSAPPPAMEENVVATDRIEDGTLVKIEGTTILFNYLLLNFGYGQFSSTSSIVGSNYNSEYYQLGGLLKLGKRVSVFFDGTYMPLIFPTKTFDIDLLAERTRRDEYKNISVKVSAELFKNIFIDLKYLYSLNDSKYFADTDARKAVLDTGYSYFQEVYSMGVRVGF